VIRFEKDNILITLNDFLIQKINVKLDEEIRTVIDIKLRKLLEMNKIINRNEIVPLLYRLKTYEFLRGDNIKKLIDLSDIPINVAEKHVISVRRGHCGYNKPLKIRLPIKASPELSLLIAKCLGDGSICKDWRFVYSNIERKLIDEIIEYVRKSIGDTDYRVFFRRKRIYEIKFPSIVGYVLTRAGAPRGLKVKIKTKIPRWILNGEKNIKSSFLRGIYDDEACVNYRKPTRRIIFAMGKHEKYKKTLLNFLNNIRNLLKDFEIESGKIRYQERFKKTVIFRFTIYRLENFKKFRENIGCTHPKKRTILNNICNGYVDIHKTKRTILNTLKKSSKPLNTIEIAKITGFNVRNVYSHLWQLAKENKINKMSEASPMIWSLINQKLLSKGERILNSLSEDFATTLNITKHSGVNHSYTLHILHKLEREGIIVKHETTKGIYWKTLNREISQPFLA